MSRIESYVREKKTRTTPSQMITKKMYIPTKNVEYKLIDRRKGDDYANDNKFLNLFLKFINFCSQLASLAVMLSMASCTPVPGGFGRRR